MLFCGRLSSFGCFTWVMLRSVLSEPLVFSVGEMQAPLRDIPRADASIVPPALFSFAGCFALGKDYRVEQTENATKDVQE